MLLICFRKITWQHLKHNWAIVHFCLKLLGCKELKCKWQGRPTGRSLLRRSSSQPHATPFLHSVLLKRYLNELMETAQNSNFSRYAHSCRQSNGVASKADYSRTSQQMAKLSNSPTIRATNPDYTHKKRPQVAIKIYSCQILSDRRGDSCHETFALQNSVIICGCEGCFVLGTDRL